jgi:hypothetical protein
VIRILSGILAVVFFGAALQSHAAEVRLDTIEGFRSYVIGELVKTGKFQSVVEDSGNAEAIQYRRRDGADGKADLHNLFGYLKSNPDADRVDEVARFVISVVGETGSQADPAELLVPSLRTRSYLWAVQKLMPNAESLPLWEPLAGDLVIFYQYDLPTKLAASRAGDFPVTSMKQLRKIAVSNMEPWLYHISAMKIESMISQTVEGNSWVSPSLILVDKFWDLVKDRFPEGALIAVPKTDQLFLFDRRDPKAVEFARAVIEEMYQSDYGQLSDEIFVWRDGKIELLAE